MVASLLDHVCFYFDELGQQYANFSFGQALQTKVFTIFEEVPTILVLLIFISVDYFVVVNFNEA